MLPRIPESHWLVFFSVGVLTLLGLAFLFPLKNDLFLNYFLIVVFCYFVFFIIKAIDFEVFSVFSKYLYIFSIILLLLTFFWGDPVRGTARWLNIGGFSLQPSEVIRPFLFLYMAKRFANSRSDLKYNLVSLLIAALPLGLIFLQPSFGVAVITFFGFLGAFFFSRIFKIKLFPLGIFIILFPLSYFLLGGYQKERLAAFINPWSDPLGGGYNAVQSMISVGSGGLIGVGLGEGVGTALKFLPEKNSDFIFAAISEEFGFIGSFIVLILFFTLFVSLIKILSQAPDRVKSAFFGAVICALLSQTFINLGMNMGLTPITGIPLPFVSEGGSSLLGTLTSLALIFNGHKRVVLRSD